MRTREELDDKFANIMFQYVARKFGVVNCDNKKVKVFSIDDGMRWDDFCLKTFLSGVHTQGDRIASGLYSDTEYGESLEAVASNFAAWSWQWYMAERDAKGQMGDFTLTTDLKKRQETAKMVFDPFDETIANMVTQYDALIFLNRERIGDMELWFPDPCVSQKVMTHECVNLIEERTGKELVKDHSAAELLDPVSQMCFDEYVRSVGGIDRFKQQYLP